MDDVIPVTLKSTLERVCRKFFNRDAAHKSPKHQRFVELYQATFEKDFEVSRRVQTVIQKRGTLSRGCSTGSHEIPLSSMFRIAFVGTGPNLVKCAAERLGCTQQHSKRERYKAWRH